MQFYFAQAAIKKQTNACWEFFGEPSDNYITTRTYLYSFLQIFSQAVRMYVEFFS